MKYIIKNCPALTDQGECYQGSVFTGTAFSECQERTDCVMKRIVGECKPESEPQYLYDRDKITDEPIAILGIKYNQGAKLAKKILDLLEIEEVDE